MKDFFGQQEQAKRLTHYLIGMFACAIAGTAFVLYLAIISLEGYLAFRPDSPYAAGTTLTFWHGEYYVLSLIMVGLVVGLGSLYKVQSLSGGGPVVAASLGGHRVLPESGDPQAVALLNVVEEMAIAAGVAVPKVYLLPDLGINAFAAGHTQQDAVIGITRGSLDQLTREELQGIVAHEFSHIVNGDMALNLKLIGVLHGLLLMHIIGRHILRVRISGNRNGAAPIAVMGAALCVGGGIGWFFGLLIKSAISRQREYLADAAAVQFTRNPDGITNALRKIAAKPHSARIGSSAALSASHMFFNQLPSVWSFTQILATHPPVALRIRRLTNGASTGATAFHRPAVSPRPLPVGAAGFVHSAGANAAHARFAGQQTGSPLTPQRPLAHQAVAGQVVSQIGVATPAHLQQAQKLLEQIPADVMQAARSPQTAGAVVFGLLLQTESTVRAKQLALIGGTSQADLNALKELSHAIEQLALRSRLPLLELCIAALKTRPVKHNIQLVKTVKALVQANGKLSLFEFSLQAVLQYRLRDAICSARPSAKPHVAEIHQLSDLWDDCQLILAALARVGHQTHASADYAYRSGLMQLSPSSVRGRNLSSSKALPECTLPCIARALPRLRVAAPKLKRAIADACAHTVLTDGQVTDSEAVLLRAVLIAIGCPIPPFVDQQPSHRHGKKQVSKQIKKRSEGSKSSRAS